MASLKSISSWGEYITIKWSEDFFKGTIYVQPTALDGDVNCFHCGKNLKSGKTVFVAKAGLSKIPSIVCSSDSDEYGKSIKTFCSSNHAKLFAKNTNGDL